MNLYVLTWLKQLVQNHVIPIVTSLLRLFFGLFVGLPQMGHSHPQLSRHLCPHRPFRVTLYSTLSAHETRFV